MCEHVEAQGSSGAFLHCSRQGLSVEPRSRARGSTPACPPQESPSLSLGARIAAGHMSTGFYMEPGI